MPEDFEHDDEYLAAWLGLRALADGHGFGPRTILRLWEKIGNPKEIWEAGRDKLIGQGYLNGETTDRFMAARAQVDTAALLKTLQASEITAIPFDHVLYPGLLRHIIDPPLILFVLGDINNFVVYNVISVVGTRNPTSYGQKLAKDIARELSANGVTICSGMAIGVDSLAHWGAIEGGGKTIAVVATGPDICYPSSNKRLYKAILDGKGVVLSEYFPGTRPEKWHFPERNRIVSGIAAGLVVVEAGESSGALITARLGFQQDRRVFAFPGRIDSPMSVGTNNLITRNVAMLISDCKTIMDEMSWVKTTVREVATVVELFGREKEIYELLSHEPTHFDVLCQRTGAPAGEMSACLTMLELAGLVSRHPGDWYSREGYIASNPRPGG